MKTERQSENVALMEASSDDGGKNRGSSKSGDGGSSGSGGGNSPKPPGGKGGKSNSGSPPPFIALLVFAVAGGLIHGWVSSKPQSNTNQSAVTSAASPPETSNQLAADKAISELISKGSSDTSSVTPTSPVESEVKDGEEVVVDFKESSLPTDELASELLVQQIFKRLNLDEKKFEHVKTPGLRNDNVYLVKGNSELLQMLRRDSELSKITEYIEPNYTYHMASLLPMPKDTFYRLQWHWQSRPGINAPEAWRIAKSIKSLPGKDVLVAVLDTGASSGKDLDSSKLVRGFGYKSNLKDGIFSFEKVNDFKDNNGHGGHLANIIAGNTNNDYGTSGIAYEAQLMPIKVLDAKGNGTSITLADGIREAANNGATVINLSLTRNDKNEAVEDEAVKEAINYAHQKDVIIVAAAGNDGKDSASYPALYEEVLGVGAYDKDGKRAQYSNYGRKVDILAPGGQIVGGKFCEPLPSGSDNLQPLPGITQIVSMLVKGEPQDQLCSYQGTSQAGAIASGGAAFTKGMLNQRGLNSPITVIEILKDATWLPDNATGDDEIGRLDAAKAAKFAKLLVAPPGSKQALAQYLKEIGAKLYGAREGCPLAEAKVRESRAQLKRLGYGFFDIVEYIDCSNSNSLCAGKKIQQYPTWEIKGKLYPGSKSLIQLARISDYGGSHNFAESIIERGDELANKGKAHDAMVMYADAKKLNPAVKISANSWNQICWFGSLNQQAKAALKSCDKAVALEPENGGYLDSRGLAKALTGDMEGAIEDFQAFIDLPGGRNKEKRKEWISSLRSGNNPFTTTELENLRRE
jgi:subtilisin family serine protease